MLVSELVYGKIIPWGNVVSALSAGKVLPVQEFQQQSYKFAANTFHI